MSSRPSPSSELATTYPTLAAFGRSYLHQDWDLDFESPEAALLAFKTNHPDTAIGVADEAAALLNTAPTEAARADVLVDLGWSFWGPPGRVDALLNWACLAMAERPSETSTG